MNEMVDDVMGNMNDDMNDMDDVVNYFPKLNKNFLGA